MKVNKISRRAFLLGLGAVSTAALLSACGGSASSSSAASGSAASGSAAAAGSDVFRTLDEIKADGTVNIGVFSDKNPFGYVDENGDLLLERHHKFDTVEQAQQYVDEKGIRFSLAFGPILVEDHQPQELPTYFVGELKGNFSREALCQMDRLHYLVVVCNYERGCYYMPTGKDLVKLCANTGCIRAYNLDGGQTSTVVMNNEVLNSISYGSQRLISDIFYFATAKPKEN